MKIMKIFSLTLFLMIATFWMSLDSNRAIAGEEVRGKSEVGRVYVMPNRATGNTIAIFHRAEDGTLTFIREVSTGGLGSGPGALPAPFPVGPGPNPLTSQDDLIITEDGRFLLAVNAGSNDISVLAVTEDGLRLTDKAATHGVYPVSIAAHKGLVYVVNEGQIPQDFLGERPSIIGFHLDDDGKLHGIPDSVKFIGDPDAEPADIVFSPDGKRLIIPDKFAGLLIHVLQVNEDGRTEEVFSIPGNNPTPFGAAFTRHDIVTVVEANAGLVNGRRQGVVNGATMSTYRLTKEDALIPISKAVPMDQTVGCWVRITPDGRFAYVTNTGSGSVSSYKIAPDGELSLLAAVAADTGGPFSGPVDEDMTPDGRFLYVVSGFIGSVKGYRIEEDGSLTPVTSADGLLPINSLVGAVAR